MTLNILFRGDPVYFTPIEVLAGMMDEQAVIGKPPYNESEVMSQK